MKLRCPTCKKMLEVPADWGPRPFCSDRCKMADLGNWLDEAYVISRPVGLEDADEIDAAMGREREQ